MTRRPCWPCRSPQPSRERVPFLPTRTSWRSVDRSDERIVTPRHWTWFELAPLVRGLQGLSFRGRESLAVKTSVRRAAGLRLLARRRRSKTRGRTSMVPRQPWLSFWWTVFRDAVLVRLRACKVSVARLSVKDSSFHRLRRWLLGRRCLDDIRHLDRLRNVGRLRRRLNLFPLDRLRLQPLSLAHGRGLGRGFGWRGGRRDFNEGDLDRGRGFFHLERKMHETDEHEKEDVQQTTDHVPNRRKDESCSNSFMEATWFTTRLFSAVS